MKNLQTFEEFLNENIAPESYTPEQTNCNLLMDYVLYKVDEDDYDKLETRIGRSLKNPNWTYGEITPDKMPAIKEILFNYFSKSKYDLMNAKFLKNTAKKNQPVITAMNWLMSK